MDIPPKRLIIGLLLVFSLGIMFAVVNGWYTEEEGDPLPTIVYATSLISIILGSFIVLLFQQRLSDIQLKRVLKVLPKDERTIIEILMANNNRLEQNYLVVLSGQNKVKISRTLSRLEMRGVIEKKPYGNTNLVILSV